MTIPQPAAQQANKTLTQRAMVPTGRRQKASSRLSTPAPVRRNHAGCNDQIAPKYHLLSGGVLAPNCPAPLQFMLYLVSNNRHAAHISSGRLNARSGMNLIERMGEVMPASPSCAAGPPRRSRPVRCRRMPIVGRLTSQCSAIFRRFKILPIEQAPTC
jgi:hypothetical protein